MSPEDQLTPEQADRLERFIRVRVRFTAGYLVLMFAVMLVVMVILARQHPDRHPSPWVLTALVVGPPLLLGLGSILIIRRVLLRPTATRRFIVSGDATDRRRVVRRLQKGQPLEPGDHETAQAQVDTLSRQRRVIWLVIPLGIEAAPRLKPCGSRRLTTCSAELVTPGPIIE